MVWDCDCGRPEYNEEGAHCRACGRAHWEHLQRTVVRLQKEVEWWRGKYVLLRGAYWEHFNRARKILEGDEA